MTKNTPTWAVVATVDEPPALVQAFVAWYLSLGAARIFIYCDKPGDPVGSVLRHLPQVTVLMCDDAHWLRVGKSRPRRHQVRQVRNARDAYAQMEADWLIHCDADEFLWPRMPVAETLAGVDDGVDGLVVQVAERVHAARSPTQNIFEGAFRRPFREPAARGRRIFGLDYDLTYRGLTGHSQGKAFVRKGRALNMSIHRPRPVRSDQEVALERAHVDALELLHFDGLTTAFWTYKLARMVYALEKRDGMPPSDHRRKQADALIADPDGAEALYDRLKRPDAALIDLLKTMGLWVEPSFDPSEPIARWFPDQPADLRPDVLDAWLQRKKAHVLKFLRA
ncbi:glycosyltransferase family 2 protein [Yoonia maricola]|nr:glycosyltransferase family 2 protein [Yoonia maricola]